MPTETMSGNLMDFRAVMQEELKTGGDLSPCPFCQLPRCQRSDYVRCVKCGVNWLDSEMHLPNYLDLDPRVARRAAALTAGVTRPTADTSKADADK